jgi:hypothetical protein
MPIGKVPLLAFSSSSRFCLKRSAGGGVRNLRAPGFVQQ